MPFSDVTKRDAPTRIKVGSSHEVARALSEHSADGIEFLPTRTDPTQHEFCLPPCAGVQE